MCGIAGYITPVGNKKPLANAAEKMAAAISHRGPNDSGLWLDLNSGVALSHRRLSILDISKAGHQPMVSKNGRFVISYNGEIYNHKELRDCLRSTDWNGESDTETLLEAISEWGIEKALNKIKGMFSFALWDKLNNSIILARDRFGEKPLYYGWVSGVLVFASELKAICAYPGWQPEINRDSLALYMRYGYVPMPYSIFNDIKKLIPGAYIKFKISESDLKWPKPIEYWSLTSHVNKMELNSITDMDAVDEVEQIIKEAVGHQMLSDVPIGSFLSGGIDSSLIVALMQANSSARVKTFTIGFTEDGFNEAEYAKDIATYLGTEHTELYITGDKVRELIPKIAGVFDEPFGDSSAIPTYLVSYLAKQKVSVALSGDGGDELFGGYNRHIHGERLWLFISKIPKCIRANIAKIILSVAPNKWDLVNLLVPSRFKINKIGIRIHKLATFLCVESKEDLYSNFISQQNETDSIVIGAKSILPINDFSGFNSKNITFSEQMMLQDSISYLPDDILVKVDRSAMANSLETRAPFLDHCLQEFIWKMPFNIKIRNNKGKWILRKVLSRYIPERYFDRPKQGFAIPIDEWLRGPLRSWASSLLDEKKLNYEGYIDAKIVMNKWHEHLSGQRNWGYWLWNVLMFQSWLEVNVGNNEKIRVS